MSNKLFKGFLSFRTLQPGKALESVQAKSMHTTAFNMVHLTQELNAEPMKAKKRIDPAVLLARLAFSKP
jgi:hypothetical protein